MKRCLPVLLVLSSCSHAFRVIKNQRKQGDHYSLNGTLLWEHPIRLLPPEQTRETDIEDDRLHASGPRLARNQWKHYFGVLVPSCKSSRQLQAQLQLHFQEVRRYLDRDMLKNSAGWLVGHPAESIGIAFSLLVAVLCVSLKCCRRGIRSEKLLELKTLISAERQKFDSFVEDMLVPLEAIQENSSNVTESRMSEKYRSLLHFLERAVCEDDQSTNMILIARYRKFMILWLKAFEDCTFDPVNKPCILCPSDRLFDVARCVDIFQTIQDELRKKKPDFAMSQMLHTKKIRADLGKGRKAFDEEEGKSWIRAKLALTLFTWHRTDKQKSFPLKLSVFCLRLKILSSWHAWLLTFFLLGTFIAGFLHHSAMHVVAVSVDINVFVLAVILARVATLEDHVLLERELQLIAAQKKQVEGMLKNVRSWIAEYDRICLLWKQTLTKLDLMEEMSNVFREVSHGNFDIGVDPLREVNEKLEKILQGMGSPQEYLSSTFLSEEWLTESNEQMQDSVRKIGRAIDEKPGGGEQLVQLLGSFFGYLKVCIHAGNDLEASSSGFFGAAQLPSSYVVGYLGQHRERRDVMLRTQVIRDDSDPRWTEHFQSPVCSDECMTLEVHNTGKEELGHTTLPLCGKPGQWIKKRTRLRDKAGKALKASLDVEYFFGDCIADFITCGQKDSTNAAADPTCQPKA